MSSLIRQAGKLASREIRKTATGGQIMRKLDNKAPIDKNAIWDWFKGFVGWVAGKLWDAIVGIFKFDFTSLWERLVNTYQTIYNWDFNQTDAALEARLTAMNKQIKVLVAEQAGRTLGTIVVGGLGMWGAFTLNAQMGMYLLQEAGTEIVQDWVGEISGAIMGIKQINEQKKIIRIFQGYRRVMKAIYSSPIGAGLASLFGGDVEAIKRWGDEKRKPWTFAGQVDAAVKSLPGDWSDIAESFLEGFGEAVIETGFTIAGALDSFFFEEALRDTPGQVNGQQRTIALIPDRTVPSERVVLHGREETLRSAVTTTLATAELLRNRDSGIAFLNQDGEEIPILKSNGIKIIITLYNYEKPPYWTVERRNKLVKSEIVLENVKRSSVDWNKIKAILGTNAVLTKGEWKCTANLDNGKSMVVWVNTPNEGERFMEQLAELIEPKIIYPLIFAEYKGRGNNKSRKFKESTAMYAAHMTIINFDKFTKYESYSTGGDNPYKNPKYGKIKIPLYFGPNEKPSWIDEQIADILKPGLEPEPARAK